MKKLFATFLLLICVSFAFAGKAGSDGAVNNPKAPVCHDKSGKWSPQDKNCEPESCGCLFHQIEEFVVGLFS